MDSKTSCEGKGDTDIFQELIIFTNTSDYRAKMEKFMLDNCADFHDYHDRMRSGEGNKLEWMDIFNEYQQLVEYELGRFCEFNDASVADIFEQIQNHLAMSRDADFLPLFMKTMEEQHLFDQLCFYASQSSRENEVLDMARSEAKGDASMSGIYHLDPERVNMQELNEWMTALSIPWAFKQLFKTAHRKSMKCVCLHTPGRSLDVTITLPFFGSWAFSLSLNGEWASCKDRVGRRIRLSGSEDSMGDVTARLIDTSGSLMMIFMSVVGTNDLRLYREFYGSGEERGSPDACLTLHFVK